MYSTIESVLFKQMNGRMAEVIIYLDSLKASHPDIFQLLSRREIADFAGVSVESGVKLLKSFERDGLIKLDEKEITIVNRQSLEEIRLRG